GVGFFTLLALWPSLGIATPCSQPKSAPEFVKCAMENHPEILNANALVNQTKLTMDVAEQRPNPELSSKVAFGELLGDSIINSEVNAFHIWEVGGKRDARISRAKAEIANADSTLLRAKENVFISSVKLLCRLRQIGTEKETVEEAISTFDGIRSQFRSRSRLSPENEISAGVFEMARNNYDLIRATLQAEEIEVTQSLKVAIGNQFEISPGVLPPRVTQWPAPPQERRDVDFRGSSSLLPLTALEVANAELEQAKSLSWPNLGVGPNFQTQTQGALSYYTVGIGLNFALPLYQRNAGGRAFSTQGIVKAEVELRSTRSELNAERKSLLSRYSLLVKALQSSFTFKDLERKHHQVENLYRRGILSSPLVIEAHRQMVDLTREQNLKELEAWTTLLRIRAIDGELINRNIL
ncbi:MAG: TolC family protein, partial [Bdellovibrionales bacterium]|nr:TolC family protein [Bdellovibrionales bacterium]